MEVGSPEWIEASIAKLEELEAKRDELEAAMGSTEDPATLAKQNAEIESLEAEIKALYAQLEAVAEEEDEGEAGEAGEDAEAEADAPRETIADDELSSPYPSAGAALDAAPPAAAAAAAPAAAAVAEAPAAAPMAEPVASAADSPFGGEPSAFDNAASVPLDDDDLKPKGGGGKWVFLGLLVAAAAGVGGFFVWKDMQAQKQNEPVDKGPPKVIKAAEVPEDTEDLNAAKGADVTKSPTAEGGDDDETKRRKKKDEKKKKKLKINGSGDPLGGGDPLG